MIVVKGPENTEWLQSPPLKSNVLKLKLRSLERRYLFQRNISIFLPELVRSTVSQVYSAPCQEFQRTLTNGILLRFSFSTSPLLRSHRALRSTKSRGFSSMSISSKGDMNICLSKHLSLMFLHMKRA
ncbi:hypothetical protein Tco_1516799 [Tanacetum coccineum]